jgi:hypothetical protein
MADQENAFPPIESTGIVTTDTPSGPAYGYQCVECQVVAHPERPTLNNAQDALAVHKRQEHQQAAQPAPGGTWHLVRVTNANGAIAASWCGRPLIAATKRNAKGVGPHERCNARACSSRWPR